MSGPVTGYSVSFLSIGIWVLLQLRFTSVPFLVPGVPQGCFLEALLFFHYMQVCVGGWCTVLLADITSCLEVIFLFAPLLRLDTIMMDRLLAPLENQTSVVLLDEWQKSIPVPAIIYTFHHFHIENTSV